MHRQVAAAHRPLTPHSPGFLDSSAVGTVGTGNVARELAQQSAGTARHRNR
jgi:hypothetical protein